MRSYVWHNDGFFLGCNVDDVCVGGIGVKTGIAYIEGKHCKPPTEFAHWNYKYKFTPTQINQCLLSNETDELKKWVESKYESEAK